MKRILVVVCTVLLCLGTIGIASATVIFQDDFNLENNGATQMNYSSFTNWIVSDGTVDLIHDTNWPGITGHGGFVDMDGSTSNAGKMTTSTSFGLLAGDYILKFDLAGNDRWAVQDYVYVQVNVGSLLNETYSLPYNSPFVSFSKTFSVAVYTPVWLSFEGFGGDNIGMLLDNVSLETAPVPEPATMLLLGSGLVGLAGFRRRFKKQA